MSNLFSNYIKRTPTSEIVKNIFVVFLVFSAFYVVYYNVIRPLINSGSINYTSENDVPFDQDLDDTDDRQRTIKPVDISKLFWNETIERDPFSYTKLNSVSVENRHSDISQNSIKLGKSNKVRIRKPRLTGIIKGKDSNFAILDGKIIKEGESHRGFKLLTILKKAVKLKKNSQTMTIKIIDGDKNA